MKSFKLNTLVLAIAMSATTSAIAGLVNINKADSEAIAHHLTGIGSKKAEAIVKYRSEHGAFTDVEHLVKVKGVGEKILSKNLEDISLSRGAVALTESATEKKEAEKMPKKPVVMSKEKGTKTLAKSELSKKQKLVKLDSKDSSSQGKKAATKKVATIEVEPSAASLKKEK